MVTKRIMFFADLEDIKPIIKEFELAYSAHYFKTGLFEESEIPHYDTALDFPNLGKVAYGDWNMIDNYLVLKKDIELNVREVLQRKGGVRYAVDQGENSNSVVFKLGGVFKEGIFITGQIATIHNDEHSKGMMNFLSRKIKKSFTKIDIYYLGKSAMSKFKAGWRFTESESSPKEYDLKQS